MPVIYEIDTTEGLIRTQCPGYVTLPEVMAHFRALELEEDCPSNLDVVLDLRETTSIPSSDELRAVSEEISRIRDTVRFGACAIVVNSEAWQGTAMVFEVFAARGFRTTRIFRELSTAEAWLTAQRSMS